METKFKWIGRLKRISRRNKLSLLVIFALSIICCLSIYASNINADTILYEDDNGIKYYDEDILEDSKVGKCSWNISESGTDDLYAYVFKAKNSNEENDYYLSTNGLNYYILVITGTERNAIDFEKAYYIDDMMGFPYFYTTTNDSVNASGFAVANWREDKVTPWSYMNSFSGSSNTRLTKIVIDNGCDPDSYAFFGGALSSFTRVEYEFNDGEIKRPLNIDGMYCGTWVNNITFPEGVDTSQITSLDGFMYRYDSIDYLDFSNCDFGNVTSATNSFVLAYQMSSIPPTTVKQIMLPKDIDQTLVEIPTLSYYNFDGTNYTKLKLNGNESGNKLIGVTSTNVTDMEGNPTNLEINCMKEDGYENRVLWVDPEGYEYLNSDLLEINEGSSSWEVVSKEARWNIAENEGDDLWATIFQDKNNKFDYILVFTGECEDIYDFTGCATYVSSYGTNYLTKDGQSEYISSKIKPSEWRNSGIAPWSLMRDGNNEDYLYVRKAAISEECNPNDYSFLCSRLNVEKFDVIPFADGSMKKTNGFSYTFYQTKLKNFSLPEFLDVSDVTNITGMFQGSDKLQSADISAFCNSPIEKISYLFSACNNITSIEGIEDLNLSRVDSLEYMFENCNKLEYELDLNNWDVSNVKSFKNMFYGCNMLKNIFLNKWDTSSVENMTYMFGYNYELEELDLNEWDVSKVEDVSYMFTNCVKLKKINLNSWNLPSNSIVDSLFYECRELVDLDLSNWDFSNSEHSWSLLYNAKALNAVKLPKIVFSEGENKTLSSTLYATNNLKFADLSKIEISANNSAFTVISDSGVKLILLPKVFDVSNIYIGREYNYGHWDSETKTVTPLTLNSSSTSYNLIGQKVDDTGTNLINCLYLDGARELEWPKLKDDGFILEEKSYKAGDEIEVKLQFDQNLEVFDTLNENTTPTIVLNVDGDGDTNKLELTFKEIDGDKAVFSYLVGEDDEIEEGSTISLDKFYNIGKIVNEDKLTVLKPTVSKTLTTLKVNIEEPAPEPAPGGSHKKKTKKVEEPKPVEPEKEETKSYKKAVMQGYEDKTFKPSQLVSREEVATIFARALEGFSEDSDFKEYNDFDDADGRWSENYLGFLKSKELVQGYADGTYRPTENMTRAELCVLICNFEEFKNAELGSLNGNSAFPDSKGRWFEQYVNKLANLGIIIGYDDGEFKGDRFVSRVEVAIIMNRINNRNVKEIPDEFKDKVTENFKDVKEDDWFFKDVALATLDLPNELFSNEESENE